GDGCTLRRAVRSCCECRCLGGSAQLFFERDEWDLEDLDRLVVGDDVVAVLEHRQQVACERDIPGQTFGQERICPHETNRDVHAWPPLDTKRGAQAPPELVPGDGVRPPELEGALSRCRPV